MLLLRLRPVLALLIALVLAIGPASLRAEPVGSGLQLLMVEDRGCAACRQWRADVLPGYAAHPQGRAAPLLIVDIDGPWPNGLALARRPQITPSFILLRNGQEVSRVEGYAGQAHFWPVLAEMLHGADLHSLRGGGT